MVARLSKPNAPTLPALKSPGWLRRRKSRRPSSSSVAPYCLLEFAEVEGRRVGKLLLCQIGCKLCLAANLDLVDRHGNQLFADAEEAADREDYRRDSCMINIKQRIFYLANR